MYIEKELRFSSFLKRKILICLPHYRICIPQNADIGCLFCLFKFRILSKKNENSMLALYDKYKRGSFFHLKITIQKKNILLFSTKEFNCRSFIYFFHGYFFP